MTHKGSTLRFAHALSARDDPAAAAEHIAEQFAHKIGPEPDLVVLFVGGPMAAFAEVVAGIVRRASGPRHFICATTSGVIAGEVELERRPAVAGLAARLPGVEISPLGPADMVRLADAGDAAPALLRDRAEGPLAGTLLLADPFSVPLNGLLPRISAAHRASHDRDDGAVLFGGLLSGSETPGGNTLIIDNEILHEGLVGLSFYGDIRCDMAVSQGCRPVGDNCVVTKSKGNLVFELGGRPALDVVREIVSGLREEDRRLLSGGLFLGRAINEYKTQLGRGDYLIRNVVGADENSNAVAVADIIPPGRSVRLHLRDATTATEDLELLLDAQRLYDRPDGVMLVTCTGRGERFFGKQNHDAVAIQRAFMPQESGVEAAKSGESIDSTRGLVPLAGFFAAGEIGPIGRESFLHGFTSCLACFRRRGAGD